MLEVGGRIWPGFAILVMLKNFYNEAVCFLAWLVDPGFAAGRVQKHVQGSLLVFIPGGRGKDKAWIITLPDNAGFNEVPEEIVSKVLTYLTSVPRYVAPF